jgi:hypothetical protein
MARVSIRPMLNRVAGVGAVEESYSSTMGFPFVADTSEGPIVSLPADSATTSTVTVNSIDKWIRSNQTMVLVAGIGLVVLVLARGK